MEQPTVGEHADPGALPPEARLRGLDPQVVHLWRFAWVGWTVVLAVTTVVLGRFVGGSLSTVLLTVVIGLGSLGTVVWPGMRLRSWGYQVRENDLLISHGVLSRVTSIVPHARIQHVDTRQEFVERRLGLARVVVFTAGIRGAELTLPGLAAADAAALRDRLAALSGTKDAV